MVLGSSLGAPGKKPTAFTITLPGACGGTNSSSSTATPAQVISSAVGLQNEVSLALAMPIEDEIEDGTSSVSVHWPDMTLKYGVSASSQHQETMVWGVAREDFSG